MISDILLIVLLWHHSKGRCTVRDTRTAEDTVALSLIQNFSFKMAYICALNSVICLTVRRFWWKGWRWLLKRRKIWDKNNAFRKWQWLRSNLHKMNLQVSWIITINKSLHLMWYSRSYKVNFSTHATFFLKLLQNQAQTTAFWC